MKRALVTGANGFVGAAVCRELSRQGIDVVAVVRNEKSNIDRIADISHLQIVYCDMSKFITLQEYVEEKIDVFYHFAWNGSAGELRADENVQMDNIKYTLDVIKACKNMGCHRFVFAGSIMEYEISTAIEQGMEVSPNTMYSATKLACDHMGRVLAEKIGVEYIRCIISNIYGPGETSPRLINTTIRKLLKGEHCSFTSGEQMYDFIYIDDAARAFVALGERGVLGQTYYIGSKKPLPLKDFLIKLKDVVDRKAILGFGEVENKGISISYDLFDIKSVERDTGITQEIEFDDGIKATMEGLKNRL